MIRANFSAYGSYVTDSLYQWDKNQDLVISGINISTAPEIHFSNIEMERALVRQSILEDGVITVRIPNSLLQTSYTIKVYIGVYEGETFKIIETIEIPIIAKTKPADYTLDVDDEEVYSFKKLENLVDQAIEDMTDANAETLENAIEISGNAVARLEEIKSEINTTLNEQNETIDQNTETSNSALAIAKGKNQAHVFATTEDMKTWLSSGNNVGKCSVGDNLYILALNVPDWWITETLTEADSETGFYYKIAQLETQKVDLSEIKGELNSFKSTTIQIVSFDAETGVLVTKSPDYVAPEEV